MITKRKSPKILRGSVNTIICPSKLFIISTSKRECLVFFFVEAPKYSTKFKTFERCKKQIIKAGSVFEWNILSRKYSNDGQKYDSVYVYASVSLMKFWIHFFCTANQLALQLKVEGNKSRMKCALLLNSSTIWCTCYCHPFRMANFRDAFNGTWLSIQCLELHCVITPSHIHDMLKSLTDWENFDGCKRSSARIQFNMHIEYLNAALHCDVEHLLLTCLDSFLSLSLCLAFLFLFLFLWRFRTSILFGHSNIKQFRILMNSHWNSSDSIDLT